MSKVLVVSRADVNAVVAAIPAQYDPLTDGVSIFEKVPAEFFELKTQLVERSLAEVDPSYLQIIPYIVVRDGDLVFGYYRGKKGGENRLHAKYSIGLGGHMDLEPTPFVSLSEVIAMEALRELNEEISLDPTPAQEAKLLSDLLSNASLVYNDVDEVGSVHLGVVVQINVTKDQIAGNETDVIEQGQFWTVDELYARAKAGELHFENWSRITFMNLFVLIEGVLEETIDVTQPDVVVEVAPNPVVEQAPVIAPVVSGGIVVAPPIAVPSIEEMEQAILAKMDVIPPEATVTVTDNAAEVVDTTTPVAQPTEAEPVEVVSHPDVVTNEVVADVPVELNIPPVEPEVIMVAEAPVAEVIDPAEYVQSLPVFESEAVVVEGIATETPVAIITSPIEVPVETIRVTDVVETPVEVKTDVIVPTEVPATESPVVGTTAVAEETVAEVSGEAVQAPAAEVAGEVADSNVEVTEVIETPVAETVVEVQEAVAVPVAIDEIQVTVVEAEEVIATPVEEQPVAELDFGLEPIEAPATTETPVEVEAVQSVIEIQPEVVVEVQADATPIEESVDVEQPIVEDEAPVVEPVAEVGAIEAPVEQVVADAVVTAEIITEPAVVEAAPVLEATETIEAQVDVVLDAAELGLPVPEVVPVIESVEAVVKAPSEVVNAEASVIEVAVDVIDPVVETVVQIAETPVQEVPTEATEAAVIADVIEPVDVSTEVSEEILVAVVEPVAEETPVVVNPVEFVSESGVHTTAELVDAVVTPIEVASEVEAPVVETTVEPVVEVTAEEPIVTETPVTEEPIVVETPPEVVGAETPAEAPVAVEDATPYIDTGVTQEPMAEEPAIEAVTESASVEVTVTEATPVVEETAPVVDVAAEVTAESVVDGAVHEVSNDTVIAADVAPEQTQAYDVAANSDIPATAEEVVVEATVEPVVTEEAVVEPPVVE